MAQEDVSIPPGPADAEYSRRALARLTLSATAQSAADQATALVPTVAEDPAEMVELAALLAEQAQEVLTRAVVHARSYGVSYTEIGERLGGITKQSAQPRYAPAVADWEDALDRPWARSGSFLNSRLPEGLGDPAFTANYLDGWCTRHADDSTHHLADREGITDRMVSANLPAHTSITRINLVLRRNQHLFARETTGEDVTAEWADQRQRRQALYDSLDDKDRQGLDAWNSRPDE